MIELKNLSKTFNTASGNVHAVRDVNLTIQDGEIFGIIGFSGAGKSTLVRCINLLERPTAGNVIIDGKDLMKLSSKELNTMRKKIGMIFQHFNLMRSRTVAQNVAFPLKGSGLSKSEIKAKVESLLELVDLKEKANVYPSQLSGGQKQRVAIARALANDPDVLLCDEATSALDPQTTQSILKLLKEVNAKLNITIVMITHEMAVVKEICDRVAVMESGYVKEEGSILDIFARPRAEITKNFIATTSNMTKIYELVEEKSELVHLKENEKLLLLSYNTENTKEAVISSISRQFHVQANIIFGNIEILGTSPLGRLVVILGGEKEEVALAMKYIQDCGVGMEVIKSC